MNNDYLQLSNVPIIVKDSSYLMNTPQKSPFRLSKISYKSRKDNNLPHRFFTLGRKDGTPIGNDTPSIYILPGDYTIEHGKTINVADTIKFSVNHRGGE